MTNLNNNQENNVILRATKGGGMDIIVRNICLPLVLCVAAEHRHKKVEGPDVPVGEIGL